MERFKRFVRYFGIAMAATMTTIAALAVFISSIVWSAAAIGMWFPPVVVVIITIAFIAWKCSGENDKNEGHLY
jgi:hypothetical protein